MSELNNKISRPRNIIGVFDSGLGGLAVLKYFLRALPSYNYIYLGDNAHVPYGDKSASAIYAYTRAAVDFLFARGCNLVILACNTASAQALRRLQREYLPLNYPERRLLGVIRPLAENLAARPGIKKIGVIGTKATVASHAYLKELRKLNSTLRVIEISAPRLVPLIEKGQQKNPESKMILKKYLQPFQAKKIDALILACTHYDFLYPAIKNYLSPSIILPRPGKIIAASLSRYLKRHPELGLKPRTKTNVRYYTTADPHLFKTVGEKFLGQKIIKLRQINLSNQIL